MYPARWLIGRSHEWKSSLGVLWHLCCWGFGFALAQDSPRLSTWQNLFNQWDFVLTKSEEVQALSRPHPLHSSLLPRPWVMSLRSAVVESLMEVLRKKSLRLQHGHSWAYFWKTLISD